MFNAELSSELGVAPEYGQQMVLHYADELQKSGKYALTIWPYHAMLGGMATIASDDASLTFSLCIGKKCSGIVNWNSFGNNYDKR